MYNNTSRVRNIELPENLFSNLGPIKTKQYPKENNMQSKTEFLKFTTQENSKEEPNTEIKLTNLSNKKEYRERINNMYEEIKDLKPIDSEIDDIVYFNNYNEKGIVVKPKVSSLKQFWTEYRLINNEKNIKSNKKVESNTLSNFDELFSQLSKRVEEINKYIDELKEMRTSIDDTNNKLEKEKAKLEEEKKDFITYKTDEEEKIKAEKASLKVNYDRLQTIINDLDKKLTEIDN